MKNKISHILWDWNGTLVDDIDLCISVTNKLLHKNNLQRISKETYLKQFTFPVVDFYRSIGFNFSPEKFAIIANEWISEYKKNFANQTYLNGAVHKSLNTLKKQGYKQSIFSACETSLLNYSIEKFDLHPFFHLVHGSSDNRAHGKEDLARKIITEEHVDPETSLLFGDTIHDYEVAQSTGLHCVLIANGHQEEKRLQKTGSTILKHIGEVPAYLKSLQ
jgi:phosphoglycolate phosphatase